MIVDFAGEKERIGTFAEVEITSAGSWILNGKLI
jgi:hypothetical protein